MSLYILVPTNRVETGQGGWGVKYTHVYTIQNKEGWHLPALAWAGWMEIGNWNFSQDCFTVYICRFVDQFPCAAQV